MNARVELSPGPRPAANQDLPFGEEVFRKLFDSLYDGVYLVDVHRRILYWNKGAERITGYRGEEAIGSHCFTALLDHIDARGCHLCHAACPLARAMRDGLPSGDRVFLRHKDGRRIAVDVHVMPIRDDRGKVAGAAEIFRDASSVVALECAYQKLRTLAERDPLTGVANRRQLDERLMQELDLLREAGIPFGLIMADLDHFKQINDTWGHAVGDQALIRFAEQLQELCRPVDLVGRYGGEEFLVILPGVRLDHAERVAERMRASAARATPPELGGRGLTASFGVAEAIPDDTPERLIRRVDAALYRAKRLGRDRVEPQGLAPDAPRGHGASRAAYGTAAFGLRG